MDWLADTIWTPTTFWVMVGTFSYLLWCSLKAYFDTHPQ